MNASGDICGPTSRARLRSGLITVKRSGATGGGSRDQRKDGAPVGDGGVNDTSGDHVRASAER